MLRRNFLQFCGYGAMGLAATGSRARIIESAASVMPRGSAENLILIFLRGAASHVDTFDLKVGNWTPGDFEPATFGNFLLPAGLFPRLVEQTDKFSILRSITGNEAVHDRAAYVLETSHTFNPVFSKEQPHFGSVLAYELAASRALSDVLPTFLAMNGQVQGPGMLDSSNAAFPVDSRQGISGLDHPGGEDLFRKRFDALMMVDQQNRLNSAPNGSVIQDYHNFYLSGERMMYQPEILDVFNLTDEDSTRYGNSGVGSACAVAVRALSKNLGTRVIQINHDGWDAHYGIYDRNDNASIYALTGQMDPALAATLEDLSTLPGKRGGSLLDETLVVVTGEFGRTPGDITLNGGRDHYPYAYSALVAGGGVVPGQAFGATDGEGRYISDRFWSENRFITINDVIATMYSSLGVDWTKEISATPSGRVFEYTPKEYGQAGYYKDIARMFE